MIQGVLESGQGRGTKGLESEAHVLQDQVWEVAGGRGGVGAVCTKSYSPPQAEVRVPLRQGEGGGW